MPRGGPRPNSGRPKGRVDNKTLDREMELKTERLRTRGKASDLEVMLAIREFWMGIAANEQSRAEAAKLLPDYVPSPDEKDDKGNPKMVRNLDKRPLNTDLMVRAMELAGHMAEKRAPYLHSRLATLTIREEPIDLTKLSDDDLATLERLHAKAAITSADEGGTRSTQH